MVALFKPGSENVFLDRQEHLLTTTVLLKLDVIYL